MDTKTDIELKICAIAKNEGFGAIYERIVLGRLLRQLNQKYKFASVLEYLCNMTKGYDNIVFIKKGLDVFLFDENIKTIKALWKFDESPEFLDKVSKKVDLVWNFAQLQLNPTIIHRMIQTSKKYVLIFTPNYMNYGTSLHFLYHFITKKECDHAERGAISLRTLAGLRQFAKKYHLKVLESNYIDVPIWPDTAFSIKDLSNFLRITPKGKTSKNNALYLLKRINNALIFENVNFLFRGFFAHHNYIFTEKW